MRRANCSAHDEGRSFHKAQSCETVAGNNLRAGRQPTDSDDTDVVCVCVWIGGVQTDGEKDIKLDRDRLNDPRHVADEVKKKTRGGNTVQKRVPLENHKWGEWLEDLFPQKTKN